MQSVPPDGKVLLSRYFDENTYLVAGKCWKCYEEEEDDVKIIGVNLEFLCQATTFPYSKDITKCKESFFELDDKNYLKDATFDEEAKNDQEISESTLFREIDQRNDYDSANEPDSCDSLIEGENESPASSHLIFHENSSTEQSVKDFSSSEEYQNLKDNLEFVIANCENSENYNFIKKDNDSLMECEDNVLTSPISSLEDDSNNMHTFKANAVPTLTGQAECCDLKNKSSVKEYNEEMFNIRNMNSELQFCGFHQSEFRDREIFNGITKIVHDMEVSISTPNKDGSLASINSNEYTTAWELTSSAKSSNPRDIKDQSEEFSFSGFEQEDLSDNISVIDKINHLVQEIETNVGAGPNNKITENLNLKSKQSANFASSKRKDINDNILVGSKMNRLMQKLGKVPKRRSERSTVYENESILKGKSYEESFQDASLVTTSKFFSMNEKKRSIPSECLKINTDNLENTYGNQKKTEFFGFNQEECERSNIAASKLHDAVQGFTSKVCNGEEHCYETKYLFGNVNKTIKKEDASFDEYPTYSRFFPSQRIDPKLESQGYSSNEHFTSFLNKKLTKKNLSRINYAFGDKTEDLIKNENVNTNYLLTEPIWHPPKSPHNLIEEYLYHDPWALLVATIFLNRTRAKHARDYIAAFLKDYTTPFAVIKIKPPDLERYFENIGLKVVRSIQLWRMSYDFVYKNWKDVKELYGVGKYGRDAFNMFCLGNLDVEPDDRYLKIYKAWYERIHLKKHVNFEQKFLDAKGYKDDDWFSNGSDTDDSGDDNNKTFMEL